MCDTVDELCSKESSRCNVFLKLETPVLGSSGPVKRSLFFDIRAAGMGHEILHLILLFGMLAGASATSSWEEPQEREHQSFMSELLPNQACKETVEAEGSMSVTGDVMRLGNGTELQLFPESPGDDHRSYGISGAARLRRRLNGVFRQCSPCTCCDRTRRWCLPTVCCYNIRCGLQGLPYGLCSFIPISCACFGCRN